MLAAAGIGAILSPPTLGAAAFIIAEYLQTSYLNVLIWAVVPTLLYYLGILLAVEIDARRFGETAVDVPRQNPWRLLGRFGYHFLSLFVIVVVPRDGHRAVPRGRLRHRCRGRVRAGRVDAVATRPARCRRRPAGPRRGGTGYVFSVYHALAAGVRAVLPVVTVCAAAGIITSVIVKTGIGQSLADILVSAGEAVSSNPDVVLIVTAVLAAVAILVLGLAVPVTASFIISWVVIGPALQTLGVEAPATAMFIFYYAVLSEVSPPTALAAVASAAITGGNTIATMWQAAKYTLPAFLAPLAFVVTDDGSNLLMEGTALGIVWTAAVSLVAVAALAAATGGWIVREADPVQRGLCLVAAVLLLYLQPITIGAGAVGARRRRDPQSPHHTKGNRMSTPTWKRPNRTGGGRRRSRGPDPLRVRRATGPGRGRRVRRRVVRGVAGQVTIATGNSTGVYYVLGGGIASLLEDKTELRASAAETGASVQNIEQLVAGDYDIAFSLADTAADAVAGTGIRLTSRNPWRHWVGFTPTTRRSWRARTRTSRASRTSPARPCRPDRPKSGTEVIANRMIEAAGIDRGDIKAQRLDIGKSVEGLKDGSIDALVWSGGLPTPALTDLYTSDADKVEFVDIMPLLPIVEGDQSRLRGGLDPGGHLQDGRRRPDDLRARTCCSSPRTSRRATPAPSRRRSGRTPTRSPRCTRQRRRSLLRTARRPIPSRWRRAPRRHWRSWLGTEMRSCRSSLP